MARNTDTGRSLTLARQPLSQGVVAYGLPFSLWGTWALDVREAQAQNSLADLPRRLLDGGREVTPPTRIVRFPQDVLPVGAPGSLRSGGGR